MDKVSNYGEGLMLRDPRSKYEFGRSTTLLKFKPAYDEEAVVLGYEVAKGGKKEGELVGLKVRSAVERIEFTIKTGVTKKV